MGNQNLVAVINGEVAFVISGDEYNGTGWTPINIVVDLYDKYIDKLINSADIPEEINSSIYKIEFYELLN